MNREAFEANYASSHDIPLETFSQYRMGDTYRLPGIASHWRTWQMALESAPGDQFKIAFQEWIDKTEWVQKTAKPAELGKHRADILKERVDAITFEAERVGRNRDMWKGQAERQAIELKSLRDVAMELRRFASCEHLHHDKPDQHEADEPCKVIMRLDASMGIGK